MVKTIQPGFGRLAIMAPRYVPKRKIRRRLDRLDRDVRLWIKASQPQSSENFSDAKDRGLKLFDYMGSIV